ncbi:hypothetical protein JW710_00500 [Candidatus Dojkabacteria bacterium]|nr:hypothetical protein [Candidatus Dojkabacteria bacterium]
MLSRQEISKIDIDKLSKVHFIGILSPFSSFAVTVLLNRDVNVTASEYEQGDPKRKDWEDKGILYPGGHNADYVTKDLDLIVYPNGPIPNNPECMRADEIGIPAITLGQMVGLISRGMKTIAVAGTHGKTTTTALITWMMKETIGEPNFIFGNAPDYILGMNKNWNVNPDSEYLVLEACEYKRQFLDRSPVPYISVITHIDLDHTDYYKDQDDYNSAFTEFLENTTGSIVIDRSRKNEKAVLSSLRTNAKVYDASEYRRKYPEIESKTLYGEHNYENMLRTLITGISVGIEPDEALSAIASFPGVTRRFEFVGETFRGAKVFNDYAHNPQKVEACIGGAQKAFPGKKIVLVFQPHSHERSHTFLNEFGEAIKNADVVVVPNIYTDRRETKEQIAMISGKEFVDSLESANPGKPIYYTGGMENLAEKIADIDEGAGMVFVLASAGDLPDVIPQIIEKGPEHCD